MKVIKIKKSGKIFLEEYDDDKTTSKKVSSLKEYLPCDVEFDPEMTFGTLFNLILREKEFFDIVFKQELNGKNLEYFENAMKKKPEAYDKDFKLEYLEVSKIFEFFMFEKGSSIDLFSVFIGMGKTDDGTDVYVPLSYCSVSELKNLEIFPNKLVEVYRDMPNCEDCDDYEDCEEGHACENEGEDGVGFIESVTRITLYEALQSIIYEISYYKSDEERTKARKEQSDEQNKKNRMGFLENQLQTHINKEDYEKAAVVKREIDKLKSAQNLNKS